MKTPLFLSVCLFSVLLSGCPSPADRMPPPEPQSSTISIPQLSDAEMMEIWKKVSTPAEAHKLLMQYIGKWRTETKFWRDPSLAPDVTQGTSSFKSILGGRYLVQEHKGTFMGMPFEGSGVLGFDIGQEKFVSSWIDSAGTGLMTSTGTLDVSGKFITMAGSFFCPLMRDFVKTKEVMTLVDGKSFLFEMYSISGDGKETKMLEIRYRR